MLCCPPAEVKGVVMGAFSFQRLAFSFSLKADSRMLNVDSLREEGQPQPLSVGAELPYK